jgi:hypothetical protein
VVSADGGAVDIGANCVIMEHAVLRGTPRMAVMAKVDQPFHERNMMGNKPHQHPHENERQASRIKRLAVALLILAIFILLLGLSATGHILIGRR